MICMCIWARLIVFRVSIEQILDIILNTFSPEEIFNLNDLIRLLHDTISSTKND